MPPSKSTVRGSALTKLLVLAAVIGALGAAGLAVRNRYRRSALKSQIGSALTELPSFVRRNARGAPVTVELVVSTIQELVADLGVRVSEDEVEITWEELEIEKSSDPAQGGVETCRLAGRPELWSKLPVTERTRFEVAVHHCAVERYIVSVAASLPVPGGDEIVEIERTMLVHAFAE